LRGYANEKIQNSIPELQQQVLNFAEFLEFRNKQLEDEGLLRAMKETKDDEKLDLASAKALME
jgi:phage terminase small subunit